MRESLAAAAVLALVAAPAAAQSVDEIVAKHIAARGGYERLKAVQSVKTTRTVATPFSKIAVVIYKKRPNLLRLEQTPPGQPTTARGINETSAWDTQAGGKVVVRPDAAAAEARELEADFDGLLVDWKDKGHTVSLAGKEPLPGGDAWKLQVTTKRGATRTIYLDAATFLDRRHMWTTKQPNGQTMEFTVDYGNWRDIDGITFPFDIDEDRKGVPISQSFATYTQKIELNVPMDDALFATPAGATTPPIK
jgi:outer membrane lipoprotein-sorting protein